MSSSEAARRKKAVALKYDMSDPKSKAQAPLVVAKGSGLIAEKILELAKEADVYVHEDGDLIEVLSKVEVGQQIPQELYAAVAKVLAMVYQLNREQKKTDSDKNR